MAKCQDRTAWLILSTTAEAVWAGQKRLRPAARRPRHSKLPKWRVREYEWGYSPNRSMVVWLSPAGGGGSKVERMK